jgi:hypothetical protein
MLGLTSPYLMITEENIPSVRGASQAYGLSFTPGTWVESIQVTKGAGSVVNGYESISGQINTELIKPIGDIPFFSMFTARPILVSRPMFMPIANCQTNGAAACFCTPIRACLKMT